MSLDSSNNNKRIAKNTLLLYFRMFFIMAVTLFTSRVVLSALGVEDYGIYNVVGGIVAMMGVLNGAMSVSTQRYLTFELGRGDMVRLKQTFSLCLTIFFLLSIVLVLLAETIGLWFLNTQLVIPQERMAAANWIYQFSILSCISSLITMPYNAAIIAHERMNVYAYVGIIEVILKLVIVYLILILPADRLISYGFLFMVSHFIVTGIYIGYCMRKFVETRYCWYWEKPLFKELISYSGWNLFGSLSGIVKGQGLNILLNMFFNPAVNAARGIAFQINAAITQFFTNFYTAVRPQITKYYAQGNMGEMQKLIFRSSKLSFYLIMLISLPIIIEAPYIVNLWLGQLPEYVVPFTRLIIAISAVDCMATPLMTAAHATGNIRLYQSSVGTMTILNVPISYIFLKLGYSPLMVFYISLAIAVICLFMRLWIVRRLMEFPVMEYIVKVFGTCLMVCAISLILPLAAHLMLEESFISVVMVCLISLLSSIVGIYFIGMDNKEKQFVWEIINKKILHKKN